MKTTENVPKSLLTSWDVAKRLSIGERTVWRWAATGTIPKPLRLGPVTRWVAAEIDQWIESKKEER